MARRSSPKSRAAMKHADHLRLWRLVEGGVYDAFRAHPDYLTDHGRARAVESITKRVVGQLVGHANEARKRRPVGPLEGIGCCHSAEGHLLALPPDPSECDEGSPTAAPIGGRGDLAEGAPP